MQVSNFDKVKAASSDISNSSIFSDLRLFLFVRLWRKKEIHNRLESGCITAFCAAVMGRRE
jgi:hypothetical protein